MLSGVAGDPWDWFLVAIVVCVAGGAAIWLLRAGGRPRSVFDFFVIAVAVGIAGLIASSVAAGISNAYRAYGEVPVPGSADLHLPAGDVLVGFHIDVDQDEDPPIPDDLELVITPPGGIPQPGVTEQLGGVVSISGTPGVTSNARRQIKVVHIPVAGDYTITTNGSVDGAVNPRLSFGRDSIFGIAMWAFGGLAVLGVVGCPVMWFVGRDKDRDKDDVHTVSDDDLLDSGKRVRGVLKSFAKSETSARAKNAPNSPESDAPYYTLEVELLTPARVLGRNRQRVPVTEVPRLVVGRELDCAVDLGAPSTRFVVDWSYRIH